MRFKLPLPLDEKNKPSLTLLCAWVSFFMAQGLTLFGTIKASSEVERLSILGISFFTMIHFSLMMRVRRVDNFKWDIKSGTMELNQKTQGADTNVQDTSVQSDQQ